MDHWRWPETRQRQRKKERQQHNVVKRLKTYFSLSFEDVPQQHFQHLSILHISSVPKDPSWGVGHLMTVLAAPIGSLKQFHLAVKQLCVCDAPNLSVRNGTWRPSPSFAHILRARQINLTDQGHIWHSRTHFWTVGLHPVASAHIKIQSESTRLMAQHLMPVCNNMNSVAYYKWWSGLRRKDSFRGRWMCQTLDGHTPAESQTVHCCCRLTQQVLQEMLLEVNTRDWPIALFAGELGWMLCNGSGWVTLLLKTTWNFATVEVGDMWKASAIMK